MPVIYKSFQSVLANKEGKKLFYPRVVLTGNVDTEQVAKEIEVHHERGGRPSEGIGYPVHTTSAFSAHLQA